MVYVKMDNEKDSIYTFMISGEEESEGTPIPKRETPVGQTRGDKGADNNSGRPFSKSNHAKLSNTARSQWNQGIDSKRAEHLKKLYDSISKINQETVMNGFTLQGRKLAEREEADAVFVPFQCYWPTYETMSEGQTKWYLYWRGRVRAGEYPDTDLSYIFLYIYEIINHIGINNAMDGFMKLCRLWSSYRERYLSLDRYMAPWLQDYISVYQCGETSDVLKEIPDKSLLSLFPDDFAAKYIGNADAELPVEFINQFSDYKFYLSKFFKEDEDNLLLKLMPSIFSRINAYFIKKAGKGIFQQFTPEDIPCQHRLPFANAVYYGDVKTITVEKFSYVAYRPLRSFFTAVIKHAENKLREKKGFKGRLRGYDLDPDIQMVINDFINSELKREEAIKNSVKVEVDREKILQLIHDSNIVQQRLLAGADPDGEEQPAFTGEIHRQIHAKHLFELPHTEKTMQAGIPLPAYTAAAGAETLNTGMGDEDHSFAAFIHSLGEKETALAGFLVKRGFEVEEPELEKAFAGEFVQNIIDNINTAAMDCIGDILIVCETGSWIVCDDYQEDLARIFHIA